ncbi:TadE family type IV pilus minor pilin [Arthrobacter sp. TWP1-1]|uniref:TadE family type IV pilus minor pilin n=1 Tax=Arthrobacter sp. TWP1-1 TaxID=2804568 RepID=UPI003CE67A47
MHTLTQLFRADRASHAQSGGFSTGTPAMRGSVTAELAVVLPAVTALLAILLLSVSAGMLQLRLEEGARAGARALARGDSSAQVLDTVSRVSGAQASVSMAISGGYATVSVSGRTGGVLSGFVPWIQTAKASARVESGEAGPMLRDPPILRPAQQMGTTLPGSAALKPALWRWARGPACPLRTGLCATSALFTGGGFHG